MAEQKKWQWQEAGKAWKGVGIYHVTLMVPSREPLLGNLVIPEEDSSKAKVVRTTLGNAIEDCLMSISHYHPEVQVLHFCLMPDHLHGTQHHGGRNHKDMTDRMTTEQRQKCMSHIHSKFFYGTEGKN